LDRYEEQGVNQGNHNEGDEEGFPDIVPKLFKVDERDEKEEYKADKEEGKQTPDKGKACLITNESNCLIHRCGGKLSEARKVSPPDGFHVRLKCPENDIHLGDTKQKGDDAYSNKVSFERTPIKLVGCLVGWKVKFEWQKVNFKCLAVEKFSESEEEPIAQANQAD